MQKAIKITEIVQTSIKEFFPFLRFAFLWLFFIITPIWVGNQLLLSDPSSFLEFILAFTYINLGFFVLLVTLPYLLHCFYKKQSPSFTQLCQHLKTCFFSISIEISRVTVRILPIFFIVSLVVFLLNYFLFPVLFFSSILIFVYVTFFVWFITLGIRFWFIPAMALFIGFWFIPAMALFNSSYQKKQIDALEYSKVLTKGYRLLIFGCFFTFSTLIFLFTLLVSYATYFILSLFFDEASLPNIMPTLQENSSLTLFDWIAMLVSYFSIPFFSMVYYKFYMLLEGCLQNVDTEEFSKKRGIKNFFKVLF